MINTTKNSIIDHLRALAWPMVALVIAWLVWLVSGPKVATWGLMPQSGSGLAGILTTPFIHSYNDAAHIINNSIAFLFMGWMLFYFYKPVAWKVWLFIWLAGGFWTWIIGRPNYHVGMSGWVYGFGFYLVTAAILRKHKQLIAGALILVMEYGSMVWGIFPVKHIPLSWEGHLTGALAGIIAAFYFRNVFPSQVEPPREWPPEEEDEYPWWEEADPTNTPGSDVQVRYSYKPKEPDNQ